ncbi:hypothetical protein R3P38DRAFT_2556571 [Favolaschia claudopus]|uniref:DUF7918 domain-containing protein n=1 Tax=Favolaschia claudopus TaxID=2862362 RepID=A0AAW0ABS6_9AGAR
MLTAKEFSAWITIDGDEAQEYNIETSENQQEVTCWIPSDVGKKFTVNWTNNSLPGLTGGGVQVDGHKCGFEAIAAETRPLHLFMDGLAETDTRTRPFVFAPLQLTDDDTYLESSSHPHLGLIKLEIWRVDIGGGMVPATIAAPAAMKVHERSKKGMNQQVQFGDAVLHSQVQSAAIRRVGYAPLVTFSFKYRSLDVLKANGIVPSAEPGSRKRKASTSPEEESAEKELDADEQEAARLKERIAALTAKRAKRNPEPVKQEPSSLTATSTGSKDLITVKAEPVD